MCITLTCCIVVFADLKNKIPIPNLRLYLLLNNEMQRQIWKKVIFHVFFLMRIKKKKMKVKIMNLYIFQHKTNIICTIRKS